MPNSYDEGVIKPHSIYIAYRRDIKQWLVGVICGAKKAEFETSRLSFPHLEIPNVTRSTLLVLKSLQRSYGGRLPLRHTSRSRGPWIARKQILDCKVTLACVVPHTHMARWRILPGALAKRFVLDFFFCSEVFEYTYVKWQGAFFFHHWLFWWPFVTSYFGGFTESMQYCTLWTLGKRVPEPLLLYLLLTTTFFTLC